MKQLKILFVTSELTPFAMTGGLGDVSASLPKALFKRGHDIRVFMPLYGNIPGQSLNRLASPLGVPTGEGELWCAVRHTTYPNSGFPVYFLEHDALYDRNGLYGDEHGVYGDNLLRFTLLSRGALQFCHYMNWYPDVIHVNDWQTSLIPAYLNTIERHSPLGQAATLLTIHNLGYQGKFSSESFPVTVLPWELFTYLGFEAYNQINLLKGGIYHSTLINTVSNTYAHEIQTPEKGEGLDGVLRDRGADLYGIVNGIDDEVWNPETDPLLDANYNVDDLSGKKTCKTSLQRDLGLYVNPDVPLISIITRLAWQKGTDVLAATIRRLLSLDIQFVLIGTGDKSQEAFFKSLNSEFKGKYKAIIDFNSKLAHRTEAASDLYLMPSRYEPCGLNQMYSMRYGTLPIVRSTGGLADTVTNYDEKIGNGTGFKFWDLSPEAIYGVVSWSVETFYKRKNHFQNMIKKAMKKDFGWNKAAAEYEELYMRAVYFRRS